MFGFGSSPSGQRMWNLMVYDVYATDKEMEQMAIFFAAMLIVLFFGIGIYQLIKWIKEWLS